MLFLDGQAAYASLLQAVKESKSHPHRQILTDLVTATPSAPLEVETVNCQCQCSIPTTDPGSDTEKTSSHHPCSPGKAVKAAKFLPLRKLRLIRPENRTLSREGELTEVVRRGLRLQQLKRLKRNGRSRARDSRERRKKNGLSIRTHPCIHCFRRRWHQDPEA